MSPHERETYDTWDMWIDSQIHPHDLLDSTLVKCSLYKYIFNSFMFYKLENWLMYIVNLLIILPFVHSDHFSCMTINFWDNKIHYIDNRIYSAHNPKKCDEIDFDGHISAYYTFCYLIMFRFIKFIHIYLEYLFTENTQGYLDQKILGVIGITD